MFEQPGVRGAPPPPADPGAALAERVRQGYQKQAAGYDKIANEALSKLGKWDADLGESMKRVREALDKAEQAQETALKASQQPPQQPVQDAMAKMGGLATVVGILGGLLTKAPMRASINAGAAAIEAYNRNDLQTYQIAYGNWKTQTDMLFKLAQMNADHARDILANEKLGMDEKRTMMDVFLRASGMHELADAALIKGEQVLLDRFQYIDNAIRQERIHREQIELHHDEVMARLAPARLLDVDKQAEVQRRDEQFATDHPDATDAERQESHFRNRQTVEREMAGAKNPPRNAQAMFAQMWKDENPRATSKEFEAAQGEYRRIQALESGFASGLLGRNVVSLNTVADHILRVAEYGRALNNGEIPRANAIANWIARETGKPEITTYEAGREIMAGEIVRLLTSTGGAKEDRERMLATAQSSYSPAEMAGATRAFIEFTGARFDSLKQQYAQGDKAREDRFMNQMLTDPSRAIWSLAGGHPTGYTKPVNVPLPEAYRGDPDGTPYRKDGLRWEKRGDQMILMPGVAP